MRHAVSIRWANASTATAVKVTARAECSCGWKGFWRYSIESAESSGRIHTAEYCPREEER